MWTPPWTEPSWLADARTWIDRQLEAHNLVLAGDPDQFHVYAWSTVIRLPTDEGDFYFKAGGPSQDFEPALLSALAEWRPADTLALVAADEERGWMLLPDGGTTLRQAAGRDPGPDHYRRLLPQYAELQIETARHPDQILASGCPDRRLETLPSGWDELLDTESAFLFDGENGWSLEELDQLQGLRGLMLELCGRVEAVGVPAGLDHGDLHSANILFGPRGYVFFDWGDASLTHPFFSMTVTMRAVAGDLNSQDPRFRWARDAYLEPFTEYAPHGELVVAFDAAQRLGRFHRALSWWALFRLIHPDAITDWRGYAAAWMWLFLTFPEEDR